MARETLSPETAPKTAVIRPVIMIIDAMNLNFDVILYFFFLPQLAVFVYVMCYTSLSYPVKHLFASMRIV